MLSGCKPPSASPLGLVLLVIALSAPFWLVGAWRGGDLLPGLPVSGLTAFCPSLAAAILVHREGGRAGVAVFPLLRSTMSASDRGYGTSRSCC